MKRILTKNDCIMQDSIFLLKLYNSPRNAKYDSTFWNLKLCWLHDNFKDHEVLKKINWALCQLVLFCWAMLYIKAQLHKDLDAWQVFYAKTYFLLCVRTDIIFFSQSKSQWSRLPFKMLLVEYTSATYRKLLKTLPYKELNRNLSANFDKMKIGKNLKDL